MKDISWDEVNVRAASFEYTPGKIVIKDSKEVARKKKKEIEDLEKQGIKVTDLGVDKIKEIEKQKEEEKLKMEQEKKEKQKEEKMPEDELLRW